MIGPLAARNARQLSLRGVRQASTAQNAAQQAKKTFWQIWYEPAALPIVAVVGTACVGAAWYLTRLARGPDVIWDRHGNPEPWNNVQPGTNTKMHAINKEFFTKEYSRDNNDLDDLVPRKERNPLLPATLASRSGPPRASGSPSFRGSGRVEADRVALVASLLSDFENDNGDSPVRPRRDVRSSALLQPFNHLLPDPDDDVDLDRRRASASTAAGERVPSRDGSFEIVKGVFKEEFNDDDDGHHGDADAGMTAAAMSRQASLASSYMLETTPTTNDDDDEDWGIGRIGSPSDRDMTGVGLREFPPSDSDDLLAGLATASGRERNPRRRERGGRIDSGATATSEDALGNAREDDDDDEEEVLETKSMPDLARTTRDRRRLSFAASILDELDGRLRSNASTTLLTPEEERDARERAAHDMVKSRSDGPRIKVIEKKRRHRSQSLGTEFVLPDVATPTSSNLEDVVGLDSNSVASGKATSDSLFARPASALAFTPPSRPRDRESTSASLSSDHHHFGGGGGHASDAFPSASAAGSPAHASSSRFSSTTHDSNRTGAGASSASFGEFEGGGDATVRPASALSITPSVFTSRFDPNMIRQRRAEQLAERPQFQNADAGKPPHVILMPAPLAGQPVLPPSLVKKRIRKEGPSSGSSSSEGGGDESDDEPKQPERPAGALYGRSLMDIMEERKALLKSQQRAYVPGSDGRRTMMDWKDSSPAAVASDVVVTAAAAAVDSPEPSPTRGRGNALAKLEGRTRAHDVDPDEEEEEVPLALLPAGGAMRRALRPAEPTRQDATVATAATARRGGGAKSIFGPDLVYQRELAAAKRLEEEERLEREEADRRQREVDDKRRVKDERRRLKKKMGSRALERRDVVDRQVESGEFKTPADLLRESQRESDAIRDVSGAASARGDVGTLPETRRQQPGGPAPSISIPGGLSTSTSDWFEPLKKRQEQEEEELRERTEDDDDPRYRPRTLSGGLLERHRGRQQSTFLDSDSGEEEEEQQRRLGQSARRLLPLPGEPSSQGHGRTNDDGGHEDEDEDEDDVPLGRRYSRQTLSLVPPTLELRLDAAAASEPFPSLAAAGPKDGDEDGDEDEDEDEDEVPLGRRFSTLIRAVEPAEAEDEDDVPLALRRLSLAGHAAATRHSARFGARRASRATITALDEDEDDEQRDGGDDDDSEDDVPLGLRQQPARFGTMPPYAPAPLGAMMPVFGPVASQQDASMQLALAQMQMHAAMMSGGGPGEGIDAWRRGVS